MQAAVALNTRKPDVLTCIANLSNDEVFTPPSVANNMLDALTEAWAAANEGANIWADKSVTFLDPCAKSGVFLREITRRLTDGLVNEIPDLQERVDHILTKQVFGIGITHLTALLARRSVYCSKQANGPHSVASRFADDAGNIWFKRTEHSWKNGKCTSCGASQATFDRGQTLETHAYAFIHTDELKAGIAEFFGGDMQFDVIIGNPPYQLASDGGSRDIPIYHRFVDQAKSLAPRFLVMVIPSRWMATGLGLKAFRRSMLTDRRIRQLVDYERMDQVFPGVDFEGGACYFLWDHSYRGLCATTIVSGDQVVGPLERSLDEFDIFVRDGRSLSILRKVIARKETSITSMLSADKEFGWTSNFTGFRQKRKTRDVPLHYSRGGTRSVGGIARPLITKSARLVDTWKVMVPAAYGERGARPARILGPAFVASSPSVCTQTYLFFYVDSQSEAESILSYLHTRFFRFLVSLRKITQHATRATYTWVPVQTWDREWTDTLLYAKYGITKAEAAFVESVIRPMGGSDE